LSRTGAAAAGRPCFSIHFWTVGSASNVNSKRFLGSASNAVSSAICGGVAASWLDPLGDAASAPDNTAADTMIAATQVLIAATHDRSPTGVIAVTASRFAQSCFAILKLPVPDTSKRFVFNLAEGIVRRLKFRNTDSS
jgi:hypothetical protein